MMSSELNSLANNTGVAQATGTNAAYNNAASGNRAPYGDFELRVTYGTAPTAGTLIDLYIIPYGSDGTNSVTASLTALPPTLYAGSFVVQAITTAQVLFLNRIQLPDDYFTCALYNNATGQAFPSSGSTLKFKPTSGAYT
jgi:hypothetical protein